MNRKFRKISRQRGYAAVLTPILAAVMLLSLFSLYDVGQVSSHKMRGQNAADAGAYSIANVIARDMNFVASTNRMMVAHQSTTGQFVGLSSYSRFLETTAVNLDRLADLATLVGVGAALQPVTQVLVQLATGFRQILDTVAPLVIRHNNIVISGVSNIQEAFHRSMIFAGPSLYENVVQENDPDINIASVVGQATVVDFVANSSDILEQYENPQPSDQGSTSGEKNLKRFEDFATVTIAGSDNFVQNRNRGLSISFPGLGQRGGSEFRRRTINNEFVYDWTAMDTLQFNLNLFLFNLRIPIGWGAAHALNENDTRSPEFDYRAARSRGYRWGDAWARNGNAAAAAVIDFERDNITSGSTIKPFYDLEQDDLRDTGPSMLAVLAKDASDTRVWRAVADSLPGYELQDSLDVAENGGLPNNQMISVGKAEPYFSRAPDLFGRFDDRIELGNMFNPFWQTRLSRLTNADKSFVLAAETGLSP